MLKALVQLFAEKFLVSKKKSVQNWTNVKRSNAIEIAIPNGAKEVTFIPPANGRIYAEFDVDGGYDINLRVQEDPKPIPRVFLSGLTGWSSFDIRVPKGGNVLIYCSKYDSKNRYLFFPFN